MSIATSPHHPTVNADPQNSTITARTVGWALSLATIASLAAGLVVVQYFGRLSEPPTVELEPAPLTPRASAPAQRPTVLPRMGRDDQASQGDAGADAFFTSPTAAAESPSTPRVDTASAPGQNGLR